LTWGGGGMYRTFNLCCIFLHICLRNIFHSEEYLTSNVRDTCRSKLRHSIHKAELSPDFNKKWNVRLSGGGGQVWMTGEVHTGYSEESYGKEKTWKT